MTPAITSGAFLLLSAVFIVVVMLSTASRRAKVLTAIALALLGAATAIYIQTAAPQALPAIASAFAGSIGMLLYLAGRRTT
jgi:hypothetical protein